ncbi:hypothetical protein Tco_0920425 [Tanacetum coccineum]
MYSVSSNRRYIGCSVDSFKKVVVLHISSIAHGCWDRVYSSSALDLLLSIRHRSFRNHIDRRKLNVREFGGFHWVIFIVGLLGFIPNTQHFSTAISRQKVLNLFYARNIADARNVCLNDRDVGFGPGGGDVQRTWYARKESMKKSSLSSHSCLGIGGRNRVRILSLQYLQTKLVCPDYNVNTMKIQARVFKVSRQGELRRHLRKLLAALCF